ncbi:MAG: Vitamin B12 transporter BtuB [Stenotrophomonas maltophilia]|uniref:Vitamin B12 transporter BtuB n=1 Tax=Stenotrophomonas maltophilia TaxID=40324 RepID=A0A7V8FHH9_STEMA|nr:MAG: Vitamin B12 transporter BtuB [Stenotrophomonas maltophilia]
MKHPNQRPASRRTPLALSITQLLTGGALLLAGAVVSSSAFAQERATNLDRITVTGSNIPRTNTETPSPVQVVSRQEIDRTGKTSLSEYLQTLTADGAGSIPKSFGSGFAGGGAGISLRGLGAGSTLVLLNGRRMASYGLADDGQKVFTDLSTIPLDAVERVEVLKDGASAIYGSDAIAGVVNIILRSDFQGAILRASYGTSGDGDGNQKKATLTAGTGDLASNGWNAFFSLDVGKSDAIKNGDRKNRKWIGTGDTRQWGYGNNAQFLGGAYTNNGASGGVGPNGSVYNADGKLVPLPGCAGLSTIGGQTDASIAAQGCLWDPNQQYHDLSPEEKYANVFGRAAFAFGEGGELYTEIGYSKKETTFSSTPSSVSGGWGYPEGPRNANSGDGATRLGPGHLDLPPGFPGGARVRYSARDVGPRVTENTNEFNRFLVGAKGNWGDWSYDTAYLHSGTDLTSDRTGFLRYSAVLCALGNVNCPGGVWRIGDNANLNSQALYDYISPRISARAKSSLDSFNAAVSRSLADLKGGPLGLAIGTEWRRTSNSLTPQTYTDQGDIIGLGYSAYNGTQNVYAAYVELSAPVLEQLELSGAVRYDKYDGGEGKATPKLGIKWTPADWIALRASYAEGFRAPNPAENGTGGLAAFSNAEDPVRCAAQNNETNCSARLVAIITTPNPALKPEESKNYSVGIVLQPTRSTSLTVDAWEIKHTNEIAASDTDDAIRQGNVLRDTDLINGIPGTGSILAVNTAYVNAASSRVGGIDTDIRQTFDIGPGQLEVDLQWSHLLKFERTSGGSTSDFLGTHGNCNVTNCIGTPKDKVNFGTTWKQGPWSISGVANYISKMDNIGQRGGDYLFRYADGTPVKKISSFTTFDLSGRWAVTNEFELNLSVQNLFDRIAPLDPTTYGAINYNPMHFSGAVGRYFTVGAKYTFR